MDGTITDDDDDEDEPSKPLLASMSTSAQSQQERAKIRSTFLAQGVEYLKVIFSFVEASDPIGCLKADFEGLIEKYTQKRLDPFSERENTVPGPSRRLKRAAEKTRAPTSKRKRATDSTQTNFVPFPGSQDLGSPVSQLSNFFFNPDSGDSNVPLELVCGNPPPQEVLSSASSSHDNRSASRKLRDQQAAMASGKYLSRVNRRRSTPIRKDLYLTEMIEMDD